MFARKRAARAAGRSERGLARWAVCVIALALGILLMPLVLEGALRAGGLFLEGSRAGAPGDGEILCQGDSYTFGLFLPAEAAYPARLEQLLRAHGNPTARVVNAAIPSKPTWIVKKELRADLERWKPRVVLLLAGVNNHWRVRPADHAVEVRGPAPRPWRIVSAWQRLTARENEPSGEPPAAPAPAAGQPAASEVDDRGIRNWIPTTAVKARPGVQEVTFRDRDGGVRGFEILAGAPSEEESCGWIEEDVATAVTIAREQGVVPVLLAYPATGGTFDPSNAALKRVADRMEVLFIDARAEFAHGEQLTGKHALFFPDRHPTDVGAALLARVVLRELSAAGLVRVDTVPPPYEVLEGWTEPRLAVALEPPAAGGRPSSVRVEYAPGYGAVLFLARARGETLVDFPKLGGVERVAAATAKSRSLPLEHDALLAATLRGNQFRTVTLGTDGAGLLPIPWESVEATGGGETFQAVVAIVLPKVGPVLAVSEVLQLEPSKE